jgi:hypothetical protein
MPSFEPRVEAIITRVGDRLLKRCEMDAWIAGCVMCEGRQRVAIGLRDVLSRDSSGELFRLANGFRGWRARRLESPVVGGASTRR